MGNSNRDCPFLKINENDNKDFMQDKDMNKNVGADKDKFTISCYGIKLPFEWYSMKTMVDRFGEDVTTLAYDMTSFRVQTEVSASPTFFGWVFGFNGKVQILAPESVKEQYRQMIAKADEDMQESE